MSVQAKQLQHVKHVKNQNTSTQPGEILAYVPLFCGKLFALAALGDQYWIKYLNYEGYEYRKDETYRQRESSRCNLSFIYISKLLNVNENRMLLEEPIVINTGKYN